LRFIPGRFWVQILAAEDWLFDGDFHDSPQFLQAIVILVIN